MKHELKNVYALFDTYGVPEVYPVYSHLSGLSHSSINTATAYVEHADDGSYQLRSTAPILGDTDIIQMALSLLQAASVISPLLADDPMRADIDQATTTLGIDPATILPKRVK
ncbi:hypothetical protein [Streptacidiphilus sp. PAMC 29251]